MRNKNTLITVVFLSGDAKSCDKSFTYPMSSRKLDYSCNWLIFGGNILTIEIRPGGFCNLSFAYHKDTEC